jgi:trimeric autotransporter adhesin
MGAWANNAATVYQMDTVAGTGCAINGEPAAGAEIGTPNGVAVDAAGNVYFSDTDNHLVRKIDTSGTISTLAGTCVAGYTGDGGPAAAAQLNQPYGIAVDAAGNVYVADYGNNRVRRIGTDGTITTVAGNGQAALAGNGVPAASSPLLTPRNVALDAAGDLYISEFTGHRVRKMTPDGNIATAAGIGIAGYGGDNGPATAAQLNFPAGLAVDQTGALYIADSDNARIRKVQGGTITTVVGPTITLSSGSTTALFGPVGVAVDASGVIYIAGATAANPSVGVYNPATTQWAVTAVGTSVSAVSSNDVTIDASRNLYLAAGRQVWMKPGGVASASAAKLLAGGGTAVGDGGPATAAQLLRPSAVALDGAGNLYIADTGNERVRMVNPAGQISTEGGTGTAGFSGDGGPASTAQFWSPMGVAVDGSGNIYVADTGNQRIREIGANGVIQTVVGTGSAGLGQQGMPGTQMPLSSPQGVCTNQSAVLYVADLGNNRVLQAPPGTGVTTAAGNGSQGDLGDGGPAPLAELNGPSACAVDSAGDLFIADTGNHSIREVTPDGNISTVAGTGTAGFSGDGGPATSAALNGPAGIAVDGNGNLYIADTNNNRIRQVTADGIIQTIAGGTAAESLSRPAGLAVDGSGNLYFADTGNNLIRKLAPGTASASSTTGGGTTQAGSSLSAVNAASMAAGPVAPGELISIFGAGIGPQTGVAGTLGSTGLLSTSVGGTQVQFDGTAAPVLYAQAGQVNVQVPYSVVGAATTNVVVSYNGQQVGTLTLAVVSTAPALFAVATNQDGSINSQSKPAPEDSIITLYGTGQGISTGTNVSGQPAAAPYAPPAEPVSLTIAGIPAQIQFAGSAPGLIGTIQINARVPGGFVSAGQTSVVLTVGSASSPPLTIWLQ